MMKTSAPDTARSSKISSRARSTTLRRSKQSLSIKEDAALESVKIKWFEILEEEGVGEPLNIVRGIKTQRLDAEKILILRVAFNESDDFPVEIQADGEIAEREVMRAIGSFFSSYPTITILRLIDCKLKAEAILILGNFVSESETVKELHLDLNPISGEDYSPLLTNTKLEVLSLKGCAISGRGAELISEKLTQKHMHLRVLILNTNLIDDQGATSLARSLKWNDKLMLLSLAGNNIGTEGAINLISTLKEFFLDELDLEARRNVLFERAQLIMAIVNERKESFLSSLPPMPALPPADSARSRSRRDGPSKGKKKSESRVMSKPQRILTSSSKVTSNNGEKSVRRSAAKKDKGLASEQTSLVARSHVSVKQQRSSVTAMSESIDAISRMEHEADNDTLDASDDDSISDFSRFEVVLTEDWDRKDNERRYKEKMLKKLCHDVGNELFQDTVFQDTFFSRVFINPAGKLCSRGNLTLSHLNLAYNKIRDDVIMTVYEMINYHARVNSVDSNVKKGIKMLMLEGNFLSPYFIGFLNELSRPSCTTQNSSSFNAT